ncbi:kinase-associated lipoprotein B [Peribacillus loiseleuriae]|uniref:kinase-associated lipoprotein B n=1 Tax=Peribacillus loiseleuriae TaxID=1679170 RepID=UPI003819D5C9
MSEEQFAVGDIVSAIYRTGKYIGEITEERPNAYLVRVLACAKHPMQGDLHNPKQVDVALFHQRRALAFREQMNVPKNMVRAYTSEIPDYKESLQQSVDSMKQKLSETQDEWNQRSLQHIEELEKDYFK